jgi:3-phenylpropionate/trans-cinnamate dioxygenase ferredoxin reductase subunit
MVVVGTGVAGGSAAIAMRAAGYEGRIILIGDEPGAPISRPPLSKQVLQGKLPADKARLRPASFFADRDVEILGGATVERIDLAGKRAVLADGNVVPFHRLLLATGGRARTLPHDPTARVYTLRTIADAVAIRERLAAGESLIVVGAGFIGAEVAATARSLGCDVTILEAASQPMSRVLPPRVGGFFGDLHRGNGVSLLTDVGIERIADNGRGVRFDLANGQLLEADFAVVGVGMVPNIELAKDAGLEIANGIVVDAMCRTSHPDVFAAGDVANAPNGLLGRRVRVEHWQNAQHQAAAAARNMLGASEEFAEIPWVWTDQYGLNVQIAGDPTPDDDVHVTAPLGTTPGLALFSRNGVISGVLGVDSGDTVQAVRRLMASGRQWPISEFTSSDLAARCAELEAR